MYVIRIKDHVADSCYNSELLNNYIKGKKCVIIVPFEENIESGYLYDSEYSMLVDASLTKKSLKLCDYLRGSGINVKYISTNNIGLETNNNYSDALIENVDCYYYQKYFKYYDCIIINGGVGMYNKNVTLLGHNGSDLSAVALGVRLDCPIIFFDASMENVKVVSDYDEFYQRMLNTDFNMKALLLAKNNKPILYYGDDSVV